MLVVTPLGLWLANRKFGPSIGVTGTKGKSSTTVLVVEALHQLGTPAVALGNIGVSPWTEPPSTQRVPVLEVSSYQAADLALAPPFGVLTSLGEDHLPWHGSLARYYRDKAQMFLAPPISGERWIATLADVPLPGIFASLPFVRIPPPADGGIRLRNALLAAAVALSLTDPHSSPSDMRELAASLLQHYPPLPSRLADVATVAGIRFVDDALASNPTGAAASIAEVSGALTVVIGGASRGASLEPLVCTARDRRRELSFVCVDDANEIAAELRQSGCEVVSAGSIEEAVVRAAHIAAPGSTVLFSPAMPTPPDQGTWESRSSRFRAAVGLLANEARGAGLE